VRAVASSKLPALTASDAGIFQELLKDVWPQVEPYEPLQEDLRTAIHTALAEQNLIDEDCQVCPSNPVQCAV
jgi:hypothetical protein